MSFSIISVLVAALALGGVSALPTEFKRANNSTPPAVVDNTQLLIDIVQAPTAIKKFQKILTVDGAGEELLSGDALKARVVFDFNGATPATGATGGALKAANGETFPVSKGLGISTTLGFLDPCGLNTPHIHPRATEFLTVVEGELISGMVLENNLVTGDKQEITTDLQQFQGTVFPQGSFHYQFNPSCDNKATFVAALSSDDPGTTQIAQNAFLLDPDVVLDAAGILPDKISAEEFEKFRKALPVNVATAVNACRVKCGMTF
ncbi:RmlC-like cupin [Mytilinidion resinicola]|uniref:RmlC-like cupin n=1 Tax=Mytilinidion resinicola TaxID=574789 RepID=A0A6A6Y2I8_9PEZI|nr:RmlC-like cupin [Mytilinidion resinicola]KAF2802027.1 RmlC-like cupin [Mytilinidion resinicola]